MNVMSKMLRKIPLDCVSREEVDMKISSLRDQLNYWQNQTINILKDYVLNDRGTLYTHM